MDRTLVCVDPIVRRLVCFTWSYMPDCRTTARAAITQYDNRTTDSARYLLVFVVYLGVVLSLISDIGDVMMVAFCPW